ncbi:hypothetical protein SAMN05518849_11817 [Sphingobium sp. AP50]|nr:hypothetical protein SAMN05518849_11817 [Sphingobium sp. AP50]
MAGDVDAHNVAADASVEALDHGTSLPGTGLSSPVNDLDFRTCAFGIVNGKAVLPVLQDVGNGTGKTFLAALREVMALPTFLSVVSLEMDEA